VEETEVIAEEDVVEDVERDVVERMRSLEDGPQPPALAVSSRKER